MNAESEAISRLECAKTASERNAAAIALSDMGSAAGMQVVRKLLRTLPCFPRQKGTLLYAMREARTPLSWEEIARLILEGGEAKQEAIEFIDDGLIEDEGLCGRK